jgi:hypothetical protein
VKKSFPLLLSFSEVEEFLERFGKCRNQDNRRLLLEYQRKFMENCRYQTIRTKERFYNWFISRAYCAYLESEECEYLEIEIDYIIEDFWL